VGKEVRAKKFKKLTKLEISWEDIVSDPEWKDTEAVASSKTASIKTLGYYLETRKGILKVGHSVSEDGDSDVTCIPWSVITNVETI
jgi:hypothetical protein